MLDRSKTVVALQKAATDLFIGFAQEITIIMQVWAKISIDKDFSERVEKRKQSLLVPSWQGLLGAVVLVDAYSHNYAVIAVDGSQIYYDKHQGPPCFLINIGFIKLGYGIVGKSITCGSEPFLTVELHADNDFGSQDFVNMQRESHEFTIAFEQMLLISSQDPQALSLCLFDGSLIFFHLDYKDMEFKEQFLEQYCTTLEQFYQHKMLIAGYMSLPRTKELVNLCKLELAQFDVENLQHTSIIDQLTDVDILDRYLQSGQRSIIFKSKAPICYLYPNHLQPYFCYLHVGSEVARVEFPAWIAESSDLVDKVCSIVLDQALKGRGYPVCLFEAHEQAVIKSMDRQFFYIMLEKLSQRQMKQYTISQKSIKKQQPII